MVTPGALHAKAACPSPSSSFAVKRQALASRSHVAVAQPSGVVGGSRAAHWESVVQLAALVVLSGTPPSPEGLVLLELQPPAPTSKPAVAAPRTQKKAFERSMETLQVGRTTTQTPAPVKVSR
jgi:hypothetical protein